MLTKGDRVIVTKTYIAKVRIGEGSSPSLFNVGKNSFGKVIGFQDDWACVNFEEVVIDETIGVITHESGYANYGSQYWIPGDNLSMMVVA